MSLIMKIFILAAFCSVVLTGCGSSDEKTDNSQGEKEKPEVTVEKNNWDEGNWNDFEWK
ncbi:MAG: major membrane immunogen (membrane-anchored lipoprotein) [Oceanicoccus sp.]|jgi:major membrane immunogen (membrane-anchored lipoprotein)